MKNNLQYYYNLELTEINEKGNMYNFEINGFLYYFVPYKRPIEDLKEIYHICEELLRRQYPCHSFILNKDSKLITTINEENYLMLKINADKDKIIKLADINLFSKLFHLNQNNKLYRGNWGKLWSEKIDYFEYQIRELGKNKEVILNSFSYFVGLTENAISYVNKINNDYKISNQDIVTIAHRKLHYPNFSLNYNNPLNYVVDLEVRDVAEYIKMLFFNKEEVWDEIENYFQNNNLTDYSCQMLYARLLYPSYYFDMYEDILNGKKKEDELLNIIELIPNYENFLYDMYLFLKNKTKLPQLEWLMAINLN